MRTQPLLQFAVYAAYRNRLETAFLADELASAIPTAADCTSRPPSPKREAGQGSAFGTPPRSIAGSPGIGSPSQQTEHLQITQPDGGTALASRQMDQRSSAPKDEAAASAGVHALFWLPKSMRLHVQLRCTWEGRQMTNL